MSKIICDICGTTYQDTAEQCPICGCTRDSAAALFGEEIIQEELVEETREKGGKFSSKKKKEIFDFDEVNSDRVDPKEEQNPYEDDEEEYEEAPRTSVGWIIVLTILIVVLLGAAGFIFMRFILPNLNGGAQTPQESVAETYAAEAEAVVQEVRCQDLIMTSGKTAELNTAGQYFMLHVIASPADTTDKILYESSDTGVVTVTEDGKLTAVSEGEATVYITCGDYQLTCNVICRFVEETLPPVTEAAPVETEAPVETAGEDTEETTAEETTVKETEAEEETADETTETKATEANKSGVTLKLKKSDISLAVYYQYTLELDCDLEPEEVEWSSEHSHIATVDEKGVVTAKKSGTTAITAKYGDQEVQCIIRCYK